MKNKELVIVGAGETALLACEYFKNDSEYDIIAFAVDDQFILDREINGVPVIGLTDMVKRYPPSMYMAFVAMGSGRLNRDRMEKYIEVKSLGYSLASYVSSRAFVWSNVIIGENCFILEHNTLQPFVEIGNNVTLWSGNHIGHRSKVLDHCFVSSHCVVSGFCEIGEASFLGVNCTLEDHVKIAPDNFIGAGALIQKETAMGALHQERQTEVSKVSTYRLFRVKEK